VRRWLPCLPWLSIVAKRYFGKTCHWVLENRSFSCASSQYGSLVKHAIGF
jgi:hypothetical protein